MDLASREIKWPYMMSIKFLLHMMDWIEKHIP